MREIKRYHVRGIHGDVHRVDFEGRIVDFWAPEGGSDHVLIAHDGQNIFDRKTATLLTTWKLAQTSTRIFKDNKQRAPLIIGVFHSKTKIDPHGRIKDLCPEDPFHQGIQTSSHTEITSSSLRGNKYLQIIFEEIVPFVADVTKSIAMPEGTAMVGSSMGGLATLYAATKHQDKFHTALAFSPHWSLAGNSLVEWLIPRLPNFGNFKIWMSRGTKGLDSAYEPFQSRVDQMMKDAGWGSRYRSRVFHGAAHNERSWSNQVDKALQFWLETH
mgnify:CR=1 FL=1